MENIINFKKGEVDFQNISCNVAGRRFCFSDAPKPNSSSTSSDAEPVQGQTHLDITLLSQNYDSNSLENGNKVFKIVKEICECGRFPEFSNFKPDSMILNDAISLLIVFVIRGVLRTPSEGRKEEFTERKLQTLLLNTNNFQDCPEKLFEVAKDLFPKDRSPDSLLIMRAAISLATLANFPDGLESLVQGQLEGLIELFKVSAEEKAKPEFVELVKNYMVKVTGEERVPVEASCPDRRAYLRFASQFTLEVESLLAEKVAKQKVLIAEAWSSFQALFAGTSKSCRGIKPSAGIFSNSSQTVGQTQRFNFYLSKDLPRRCNLCTSQIADLRVRTSICFKLVAKESEGKVGALLREINTLEQEASKPHDTRANYLLSLIDYLSILLGTENSRTAEKSHTFVNRAIENQISTIHVAIFQVMGDILEKTYKSEQRITKKQLQEVLSAVVAQLVEKKFDKTFKKAPGLKALSKTLKKAKFTPAQTRMLTQAFDAAMKNGEELMLDFLAGECDYLRANLSGSKVGSEYKLYLQTIIAMEWTTSRLTGDLDFILDYLSKNQMPCTPENFTLVAGKQLRAKIAGSSQLSSSTDELRDLVAQQAVQKLKNALVLSTDGLEILLTNTEARDKLDQLFIAYNALLAFQETPRGVVRMLLGGIPENTAILTVPLPEGESLVSAELQAETKEREILAELAAKELITQNEEELEAKSTTLALEAESEQEPVEYEEAERHISGSKSPTDTRALSPSGETPTSTFVIQYPSSRAALGEIRLTQGQICHVQSQIAFHQTLTILATLMNSPKSIVFLVPSLLETLHITLEQSITAHGFKSGVVRAGDILDHKLCTRARECGLTACVGDMQKIGNTGTYNARYPHLNKYTLRGDSFIAKILRAQEEGSIAPELVREIATHLNHTMGTLMGVEATPGDEMARLQTFAIPDEPLQLSKKVVEVKPIVGELEKRFSADSHEKEDLIAHLVELEKLTSAMNKLGGIPKELSGIVLHALLRIQQYTTKNLMILLLRERGEISDDQMPARHEDLATQLELPEEILRAFAALDMKKGLDYPLGMRHRRKLTENESLLLNAHHLSLSTRGFESQEGQLSEKSLVTQIELIVEQIQERLGLLLTLS